MSEYLITIDTDYANSEQLAFIFCLLKEYSVPSTVFVTNYNKMIEKEFQNKLFTFGIHPDFSKRSKQGRKVKKVMKYCLSVIPNAKHVRTHRLIQDAHLLRSFCLDYDIKYDYSLIMPFVENLRPFIIDCGIKKLTRIPYYISDAYLIYLDKNRYFNLNHQVYQKKGLKVFNFHPLHIFLNSYNLEQVTNRQENFTKPGSRDIFLDVLKLMSKNKVIRKSV